LNKGAKLYFIIKSIVLIFQVIFLIQTGFRKQETALLSLFLIKSAFVQTFIGLLVWDWELEKKNGRKMTDEFNTIIKILKYIKQTIDERRKKIQEGGSSFSFLKRGNAKYRGFH